MVMFRRKTYKAKVRQITINTAVRQWLLYQSSFDYLLNTGSPISFPLC